MAQENVFGHLMTPSPQPVQNQDPIIKPRDPYKDAAEQRAQQDQALQQQAAAREAERLRLAQQEAQRGAQKDVQGSVEQGKSAGFLLRALGADDAYRAQEIGARSYPGQKMAEIAPDALNTLPESIGNSPRRQVSDSSQDEFIAATLRYESGAAIPPAELEAQRRRYFPMPGDSEDQLLAKRVLRRNAIEALKQSSGPLAEPTYQKFMGLSKTGQADDAKSLGESFGLTGSVTDTSGAPPPSDGGAPSSGGQPPDGGLTLDQFGRGLAQGAGDIVEAVGDFPGIITNPISTTIGRGMGYNNYTADLGTSLREALGLPDNSNQIASAINKGGVGALTGSLAGRAMSAVANPGAWQNALLAFGRTPGRDMLAGAGAGAGGEVGRELGGVPGQVAGTLAGGVVGYAGGNAMLKAGQVRTPDSLLRGADDLGVTMMPADVGRTGTRMASGAVKSTLGGIPMAQGAEAAIGSAAAARNKIAGQIGETTDNVGAGQAVKRGFDKFENNSRARADELYEKISVPAESSVQLGQTRGALAEVTRGMQSNPELSRLWANHPRLRATLEALTPKDLSSEGRKSFQEASDRLSALLRTKEAEIGSVPGPHRTANLDDQIAAARQDLAAALEKSKAQPEGGQLSWQDMKRFRSIVGEVIGQPGIKRDGSDIAALRKLYEALSSDMEVTAAQSGPRALQEFRRATQYWRGRESRIDDVFAALLGKDGKRSDEAVFKQINTWAQGDGGDFSRIARTIRSMPEDEANTIRATLIQRMGMAKPANQNATEEVFSPAIFSTQWRGMSGRAKSVLFPNQQHRQDLEKLAEITDGMKHAEQYRNFSNTAVGVNATMQGSLALANLPAAVVLAAVQFGAGKLLSSPRFARIIASSVKLPPEQAGRKMSEQLKVLAAREPIIANDLASVQRALAEKFSKSPGSAAAEDRGDGGREPPPNQGP